MKRKRPNKRIWLMTLAQVIALRSTCIRRPVGCVITDSNGLILATGYNGVAVGKPHCNEGHPCIGAFAKSGVDIHMCNAVHAEQNALVQCSDIGRAYAIFCTTMPCSECTKLLLNTSIHEIWYHHEYVHSALVNELWRGRLIKRIEPYDATAYESTKVGLEA